MDPTSFGFVAATAVLIIIISYIVFRMYPKETDFEKAYGKNALRLLMEDRVAKTKSTKSKNKSKNGGEKKKDAGGEEKESHRTEKLENGLFYAPMPQNDRSGSEKSSNGVGGGGGGGDNGDVDAKPNRKKQKGKHPLTMEIKQPTESERTENEIVTKVIDEPLQQQQQIVEKMDTEPEIGKTASKIINDENRGIDVGERKARKKNRARRAEEHLREISKEEIKMLDQEEAVRAVETVAPLGSEKKKQPEKMKPKKFISLKDINADKFQARLIAVTELEPEYITFIANYINDMNTQKARWSDEIATLRKQIADKDRLVLQCTDKLTAAEKKDAEVALLQKTLAEEKKKHKVFEQTVCTQMSNSAQEKSYLQRKYDQLQADLGAVREELKKAKSVIHSAPPPVDIKPYQQKIDLLKAELTSNKSRCSQLEIELNQRLQALQQIKNESQNRDRQMEHLSKTNSMLEKRLQDVEGNAKAERDALEMKLQNTMKMVEELVAKTSGIRDEMLQHKENAETAVQEREKYCEQIRILNAQLLDVNREREDCMSDCANYRTKLAKTEVANRELSNQLQALQNANASSDAKFSELIREVEMYRHQLADNEKQHEEVTAKLKNELAHLQEEKDKCQKQMSLDLSKEVAEVAHCRKELEEFRNEYNRKLDRIKYLEEEMAKYKKTEKERQSQATAMPSHDKDTAAEEAMKFTYVHKAELAAVVTATAAPTSGSGAENLNMEINELKKQNEELREANYKVVEISQQQEAIFKKHLEELKENHEHALRQYRSEISKTLSAVLPAGTKLPNLPDPCDTEQFCQWLKSAENALQKNENVVVEKFNKHSEQFKKNENNNGGNNSNNDGLNESRIAKLEAGNRRYRTALATLSSHIDAIEQEAVLKEKVYLSEIARLRQEISKQLRNQLDNERKRKMELISQASKLYEVINRPQKYRPSKAGQSSRNGNSDSPAFATGCGGVADDDGWEVVER